MAIYVSWLVDCARAAAAGTGKQVIVSPGWDSRGHGGMRVVEGVVGHHTGTPESAPGDYPSLNVVQNGRSDLAGPLSNFGLGRSGNIYVIAAGLCYHAGASAYAGFVDLNDEFLGIEAEDSGDGVWNDAQLFMYPRLVRACLDYMRRGVDRYASHRTVATPAGRKNDPWGITDDWMRQRAASAWDSNQQGDDVAFTDQITVAAPGNRGYTETGEAAKFIGDTYFWASDTLKTLAGTVVPVLTTLASAVTSGGLDKDALMAALSEATRAGTEQAVSNTLLPAVQRLEDALAKDDVATAKAVVAALGAQLRAAAPISEV
jgi:N-acetylmuramoyl-L-alanine amidase-like protein